MKYILIFMFLVCVFPNYAQTGVDTKTPQKTLHVNGALQVTSEVNVGGTGTTQGSAGTSGQLLVSNSANQAPSWQTINVPKLPVLSTGTVIAITGEYMIAQEIAATMTQNSTVVFVTAGPVTAIPYLVNEAIDNHSTFTSNASGNSFTVSANGVYQIMMNFSLTAPVGTSPVIGVWNNSTNLWVARINDLFYVPTAGGYRTYTLITAIELTAGTTYSFRWSNTEESTIRAIINGKPINYVSLKRLK